MHSEHGLEVRASRVRVQSVLSQVERPAPAVDVTFILSSAPFGTHVHVELVSDADDESLSGVDMDRWLDHLREQCEAPSASAVSEPVEGGDPACWLHLHFDGNAAEE